MSTSRSKCRLFIAVLVCFFAATSLFAQTSAKAKLGSDTAKGGFRNEDAIRDKFNSYRSDDDAKAWLREMSYDPKDIISLRAEKPHGEKADVEVAIETKAGIRREGISIKLVSGQQGVK